MSDEQRQVHALVEAHLQRARAFEIHREQQLLDHLDKHGDHFIRDMRQDNRDRAQAMRAAFEARLKQGEFE